MGITGFIKEIIPFVFLILFIVNSIMSKGHIKTQSIVLSFYFLFHIITGLYQIDTSLSKTEYLSEYLSIELGLIRLDGAFSLIFTIFLITNKKAKYLAALLCCAVFTHSMLIYHLQQQHSWLSSFIYGYCDELIIIIWLAMMAVARDGLITAFNNISLLLRSGHDCRIRSSENLFRRTKDQESP